MDPDTTDEERARFNVRPLAEALQRAERMNIDNPPDRGAPWQAALAVATPIAGPIVAELRAPNLRVVVFEVEQAGEQIEPDPEPLGADEVPHERPAGLDPSWTLGRYVVGYAAVRPDGQVACFWFSAVLGPDHTFAVGWLRSFGSAPRLEAVRIDERTGILYEMDQQYPSLLVIPREDDRAWILGGKLERGELVRLTATLPA